MVETGLWRGKDIPEKCRCLILGESHYGDGDAGNKNDKLTETTYGVVQYYLEMKEASKYVPWFPFFDKIAQSFGYSSDNIRPFYEKVYFGNYVDEDCGKEEDNSSAKYISSHRPRYNNQVLHFVNKFSINVIVCFSMKAYWSFPSLAEGSGEAMSECYLGMVGKRKNILRRCKYMAGIEHKHCNILLKDSLTVYGIRHPSSKCGYSYEQVLKQLREEDILQPLICGK